MDCSVCGGVATDGMVTKFQPLIGLLIDCWAQLIQDTLNAVIDQLPKRMMIVIKAKGATAHVELHLNYTCVLMIVVISLYDQ